ncbi:NACHT domain-containing protein [Actinosynnema sp. NPDC020468]|uniref:NACHT domain-containing protein n=1 Tax=Actinosynnema sp. NPDC020468 TaxID=3154488 RepID=UPI0033C099AB
MEPVPGNQIGGDVEGISVQAGYIGGGVHFHSTGKPVVVPAPRPASLGWSDLPELPDGVRSLMAAQVHLAQDSTYKLRGARRPQLDTVYVRQELGTAVERPEHESWPVLDKHDHLVNLPAAPAIRVSVRPPSRTVRDVLDQDEHLLVTGGPGQGKSTLSLRLAADVVGRWEDPDADTPLAECVVPLRLTASTLAARLGVPFPRALADSASTEYGALLGPPIDAAVFGDRVAGCRWLLLVDGLDEIVDTQERDTLVRVLARWAGHTYRVVLTTRPIEGTALAPLHHANRYELQPFDEEALERFARNWFPEADAERFLHQVRDAHLKELVQVPLLATIAAIVFEQHTDRPLPDNQYELYEAYLTFLCADRPAGRFEARRTALLEHLGRTRLESDTPLTEAAQAWVDTPDRVELMAFLVSVGLFTIRNDDVSFLHHSFAEHLAATARARELPEVFDPAHDLVDHLLHVARSWEPGRHARAVLLHYTRLRPDQADALIDHLHAQGADQHVLAARLLANHAPVSAEVLTAFLVTARSWAMVSGYPGTTVLGRVSRAGYHRGLVAWLADLMRDEAAPWSSRASAATALANRLRGAHTAEALAFLREVVDDAGVPVRNRLVAAEALAQSGPDERAVSERGLRAVLADPSSSGASLRTAAVVLSAFGREAKAMAAQALSVALDSGELPTTDVVQVATGLVEVGAEFAEHGAEVFRAVLRDPVLSLTGRSAAAKALASLGATRPDEAADALFSLSRDLRLSHSDRVRVASAVADLGPRFQEAAGTRLVSLLTEPGVSPSERVYCADDLARLGGEWKREGIPILRDALLDPGTTASDVLWASVWLAKHGPDFRQECGRALRGLLVDPLIAPARRTRVLSALIDLGEPFRSPALDMMLTEFSDPGTDHRRVPHLAGQLVNCGPGFHAMAVERLVVVARHHPDPRLVVEAWQELVRLREDLRDEACAVFLDLVRGDDSGVGISHRVAIAWGTAHDHDAVAGSMFEVLDDAARTATVRLSAALGLLHLGRGYEHRVCDALVEMCADRHGQLVDLGRLANCLTDAGIAFRDRLVSALRSVIADRRSPSARVWQAVRALDELGVGGDPDVVRALKGLLADRSIEAGRNDDAAVLLARWSPEDLEVAVAFVTDVRWSMRDDSWRVACRTIARLGGDVTRRLRAIHGDPDSGCYQRVLAAQVLADLGEVGMSSWLRSEARNECSPYLDRSGMYGYLVEADPAMRSEAVTFESRVVNDDDEEIATRCMAASRLAGLDRTQAGTAVAALRRFASGMTFTASEKATAVLLWDNTVSWRDDEMLHLILGAALHRAIAPNAGLLRRLPLEWRKHAEHALWVDDYSWMSDRRLTGRFRDRSTVRRAEVFVRETLTAAESSLSERVSAAGVLASLSAECRAEAVDVLTTLAAQPRARFAAWSELSALGAESRGRVLDQAEELVVDGSAGFSVRWRAAQLAQTLDWAPSPSVAAFFRHVARGESGSEQRRVTALFRLRLLDGLAGLRAIRDDVRSSTVLRWKAADVLGARTIEDRRAGAAVLGAIARDRAVRPRLRWAVAEDLVGFGAQGRAMALDALQDLLVDESVPLTTRVASAGTLNRVFPGRRRQVLDRLRAFLVGAEPTHRRLVFLAIGEARADEGAEGLREMAFDPALSPWERLSCAVGMVDLRRDQKEFGAVVAREIAFDDAVPRHIRDDAACHLAWWSPVMKEDARALLKTLRGVSTGGGRG